MGMPEHCGPLSMEKTLLHSIGSSPGACATVRSPVTRVPTFAAEPRPEQAGPATPIVRATAATNAVARLLMTGHRTDAGPWVRSVGAGAAASRTVRHRG